MMRAYKPYQPTVADRLQGAVREAYKAVDNSACLSGAAVDAEVCAEPCGTALYKLRDLAQRIHAPGGGGRLLVAQARTAQEFAERVRRSPGAVGPVTATVLTALESVADAAMLFWRERYEGRKNLEGVGELRAHASSLVALIDGMGLHARGKFV